MIHLLEKECIVEPCFHLSNECLSFHLNMGKFAICNTYISLMFVLRGRLCERSGEVHASYHAAEMGGGSASPFSTAPGQNRL